jgi:hypothetical protein
MAAFVDSTQVACVQLSHADGTTVEALVVPLVVPLDEVPALLAEYEPENSRHPLATLARPIARPVLDALRSQTWRLAGAGNNG